MASAGPHSRDHGVAVAALGRFRATLRAEDCTSRVAEDGNGLQGCAAQAPCWRVKQPPVNDERLIELELRYTEQQALLQELSDVVYRQQRELDALRAELLSLRASQPTEEPGPVEKPPHY